MSTTTKPYLIRALHEWCTDNGLTPYLVVWVNEQTSVPQQYVKNNEIVLNIDLRATKDLQITNDWLSFSARFSGVSHDIWVPIGNVMSIFARETGEGMGFEVELKEQESVTTPPLHSLRAEDASAAESDDSNTEQKRPSGRPNLHIVK